MNGKEFEQFLYDTRIKVIENLVGKEISGAISRADYGYRFILVFTDGTFVSLCADDNEIEIDKWSGGVSPEIARQMGIINEEQFAALEAEELALKQRIKDAATERRRRLLETLKKEFGEE